MSDQPQFKVIVTGDGTRQYAWELYRRTGIQAGWPPYGSAPQNMKGKASERGDCIAAAYEKARIILEDERWAKTREEIEFDVELKPLYVAPDALDSIPVAEPDRNLRTEKKND